MDKKRRQMWDDIHNTMERILAKVESIEPGDLDELNGYERFESDNFGDIMNELVEVFVRDKSKVGEAKIMWDEDGFTLKYKGEKEDE